MQRPVLPLSSETQSQLRSTQILTSLSQIISELVQNSLDAKATRIEVGVDVVQWECWVKDDGTGISKTGMQIFAQGSLAGRYGSSKAYEISTLDSLSTFGFRGEAVASAGDLCCLEISSRTQSSAEAWSLILKGGRQLYYGPSIRWKRDSPGTVVIIRDAFYSLPVRRKAHPSPGKSIDIIKKDLQNFALMFPHVSFTLEDTSKEFQGLTRGKLLSIHKTSSVLDSFRNIYGRALVEHVNLIEEDISDIQIHGFISLEGATSKAFQFLYLNNRLLDQCELHSAMDTQFARSTFGKHAFDDEGETSERPITRRSPRKGEKRPIYVLNLKVSRSMVDSTLEPSKTSVYLSNMETVKTALISCVTSFLRRNNFLSDSFITHASIQGVVVPQRLIPIDENASEEENAPKSRDFVSMNMGYSRVHGIKNRINPSGDESPVWMQNVLKEWENPIIKIGEQGITQSSQLGSSGNFPGSLKHNELMKMSQKYIETSEEARTAFTAADLAGSDVLGQVDRKFVASIIKHHTDNRPILILIDQHAADERVRIERFLKEYCEGALSFAIGGANSEPGTSMEITRLSPPKQILLTRREATLLQDTAIKMELHRWGIVIGNLPDDFDDNNGGHAQISVSGVPSILHAKLIQDNELQDALRSILGDFDMNGVPEWSSNVEDNGNKSDSRWLRAWRNCHPSLLELLDSKACRGAVMFNDPLSLDQCQRLILQQSECIFPFQCAHGRPSIAPLLCIAQLGENGEMSRQLGKRASTHAVDWKKFQASIMQ